MKALQLAAWLGFGLGCVSPAAWALDTGNIGGEPVEVNVSETSSVLYNTDNRNERPADVATRADDAWGLWSNRLDARARFQQWQLRLRVDSAWFYATPNPSDIALDLLAAEHGGRLPDTYSAADADFFVQKYYQAGAELSDRFVHWNYPAKYSLSYTGRSVEATLGDFTAQFGRGLVLSVRKEDELLGDTTLRGLRATWRLKKEPLRLRLTALAGTTNPLRVDETSGRVLGTTAAARTGLASVTELGMPTQPSTDFAPVATPNFIADTVLGAELELGARTWTLSLAGSRLLRGCRTQSGVCTPLAADLVRAARSVDTWGANVSAPQLGKWGAVYLEGAVQRLYDFALPTQPGRDVALVSAAGHALYGEVTLLAAPVTVVLEGKHYRNFYPLRANVDPGRAREFVPVQYSAVPTTLPVWNDTEFEGFNSCVTGGRLRADTHLSPRHTLFGWVGYYQAWAESAPANTCDTNDQNLNRVWDVAQGVELASSEREARGELMLGARFDATERTLTDARNLPTQVFYRELYARYDATYALSADYSLHFQGWHRRRRQTLGGPVEPWWQGTTLTGLQYGSRLSLAFGFEYDQNPAFPGTYLSGQARYELDSAKELLPWLNGPSHIALFAGQRQGGLRCVSGVCRVFAPFEGIRADLSLGF